MKRLATVLFLLPLFALASCSGRETAGPAALRWWLTCGDPACGGWRDHGVAPCTDEEEGDACSVAGATCDPVNDCNADLVCATEDPRPAEGCPISLAAMKREVAYLTREDVDSLRDELVTLRLATWRYRTDPAGSPERLGFVIDDVQGTAAGSFAVLPRGDQVDVYGLASLAVAALQAQQREIDVLRAEVRELRGAVAGDADE